MGKNYRRNYQRDFKRECKKTYYRKSTKGNMIHKRSIFLSLAILCTAFGIAVGSQWLPEQARSLKYRISSGKEEKNNSRASKTPEEEKQELSDNPLIRVVLMTNGYQGIIHKEVKLRADSELTLTYGNRTEQITAGECVVIAADDARLSEGNMRIEAKDGVLQIESMKRGDGIPAYNGVIELRRAEDGIVVVNELPIETYLCRVVPSEMPASYELEALKAQAVCARSYAYRQMESYGYPEYEAHVNDSTDYQVYGNSLPDERADRAVEETKGQTVWYQGKIVTTYYYSTSCGRTTNAEAWGSTPSEENGYLQSVDVKGTDGDYEKALPWYRWHAKIPEQEMEENIRRNTGKDIGELKSVEVTKRGAGDVALVLTAVGSKCTVTVETENKIRTALAGDYDIVKQDGSTRNCGKLLPSAFFTIKKEKGSYCIEGGGFGHGIGMSQTGANEMAKQGKNYREILELFYPGVNVE